MHLFRSALCLLTLTLFLSPALQAQDITGALRGQVTDAISGMPLPGVTVRVLRDSSTLKGGITDANGAYQLSGIPVGRYTVQFTLADYQMRRVPEVTFTSGRTTLLDCPMEELLVKIDEVTIEGDKKGEASNDMVTVSARTFSPDESERYAGSRGDPARMASNFAGVQGTDDTRNDLVIRGNSPLGVNYRLDGVNIPNPNHFAVTGSAGGPIGMLNNKVLAGSDFLTGAFPAEFGNSLSGTFDLRFRRGNTQRHEFIAQVGNFGAELTAEGPLAGNKKNADKPLPSYLVNARYSTLAFFQAAGIDIGTTAVPQYQDMSFRLNFPGKNGTEFSLFGMGGYSKIDFVVSDDEKKDEREIFATGYRDEYFRSGMGVAGMRFTKLNGSKGIFRASAAWTLEHTDMDHWDVWRHTSGPDSLFVLDSITRNMGYMQNTHKAVSHFYYRHKFNARHSLQAGITADAYFVFLHDSIVTAPAADTYNYRMYYEGTHFLIQPYVQYRANLSEKLVFNAGLHGQLFTANANSKSLEPRLGLRWTASPRHAFGIGTGLHSQLQPLYIYFQQQRDSSGNYTNHNRDMGFSRSLHFIASHDWTLAADFRIRTEVYYQALSHIPVDTFSSSFSMLNQGSGFDRFFPGKLVNEGTGRNIGAELTIEKFFTHNWFVLATASLFDSKYTASDGKQYSTDFNTNYVANVLGTKEFNWGKKRRVTFGAGGKFTLAGGKRYSPLDTLASIAADDEVPVDSLRNSLQFPTYFRFDIKLYYRINAKHVTHEIGFDFVNVTNQRNLLRLQYVGGTQLFTEATQIGFLPIFYYRVDFGLGRRRE